jgi:hypothetical protein
LRLKLIAFAFFCIFLAPLAFATDSDTTDSEIAMARGTETDFDTDVHFTITTSLANATTDGSPVFYKPLPSNLDDLPIDFFMCAGDLDINSFASGTWNEDYIACAVDYPYGTNIEPICPQWDDESTYYPDWENRDRSGGCDFPPDCMTENPWSSPDTDNSIQWSSPYDINCYDGPGLGELLECMQTPPETAQMCGGSTCDEWTELTRFANINCDYIPVFGCPPYPNQKAKGAVVCDADLTYDITTIGVDNSNPSMQATADFSALPVGTYHVDPTLSVNDCRAAVRKLPDTRSYNTAHWQYYFFTENIASYPLDISNNFTAHIVDPDNCSIESDGGTKAATSIRAGDTFRHRVDITHDHTLFDIIITDVVPPVSPPTYTVVPSASGNNGFNTNITNAGGNIFVDVTPPDPLGEIPDAICFNISYVASLPFCNGTICSGLEEVCINITDRRKPDIASFVTVTLVSGNPMDENEVYEITYWVEEVGNVAVNNPFTSNFSINSNSPQIVETIASLGPLEKYEDPPASFTLECASAFFGKGWHNVVLEADLPLGTSGYGNVDELDNTGNNRVITAVRCGMPLDCWDLV